MLTAFGRIAGLAAGGAFLYLKKFYEFISHDVLAREAKAVGFSLKLLRALTTMYAGWRACSLNGAAGEPFCATGTVIAGCSCAVAVARVMIIRLLRRATGAFPEARLTNIVDDVAIQCVYTARNAARNLGAPR